MVLPTLKYNYNFGGIPSHQKHRDTQGNQSYVKRVTYNIVRTKTDKCVSPD